MFLLSFAGFLRSEEVRFLRSCDVKFEDDHVAITIASSKTDQLREGHTVLLAKSSDPNLCPVRVLQAYMSSANIPLRSSDYLFRPISASKKSKCLVSPNKPLSDSTYREAFKAYFKSIVPDISKFSTHSCRSGGATSAIQSGASDRTVQRHGRWRVSASKDRYVKDSAEDRLKVSKSLGL